MRGLLGLFTARPQRLRLGLVLVDYFWNAVWSLTPTVILGAAFWFVMWSILRADRRERDAYLEIERQVRAEREQAVAERDTAA